MSDHQSDPSACEESLCMRCAVHDKRVDIRGHIFYCEYKHCTCEKCQKLLEEICERRRLHWRADAPGQLETSREATGELRIRVAPTEGTTTSCPPKSIAVLADDTRTCLSGMERLTELLFLSSDVSITTKKIQEMAILIIEMERQMVPTDQVLREK